MATNDFELFHPRYKPFWLNLYEEAELIDAMAHRYGMLPSQLLREVDYFDYDLSRAIFIAAMQKRKRENPTEALNDV